MPAPGLLAGVVGDQNRRQTMRPKLGAPVDVQTQSAGGASIG